MSKKTPLQKAIDQLKEHKSNSYTMLYRLGCQNAIDTLTDLLRYEREVIEEAFSDGNFNLHDANPHNTKSDYFTKKFTNNAD